jgi:acyl-CoA reductase-like NAD-dependent aldehyde dehydrogenase
VPNFIDTYVQAVSTLRVGHPLLDVPVDFGPLISAMKVNELQTLVKDAESNGAEVIYRGVISEDAFEHEQNRDSYMAPTLLTSLNPNSDLYKREPFGPLDVLVPVDSETELIREANVSNGALVASVATDDPEAGEQIARRLHAFKVGINCLRSRGDRGEPFGGMGDSWEGAFVGGVNLVRAFTSGTHLPYGNWPD